MTPNLRELTFKPSTIEGHAMQMHMRACPDCETRSSIHDAYCQEGVRLRNAYVVSLERPITTKRSTR